jgi:hypothetical protein
VIVLSISHSLGSPADFYNAMCSLVEWQTADYRFSIKGHPMSRREPFRAGQFYEGAPTACREHAEQLIREAEGASGLPETLFGGIVPHAGWVFSGTLAARTLAALHASRPLKTVILFGADHTGSVTLGEVYDSGSWATPVGDVPVDESVAAALIESSDLLRSNPRAHDREHSLEVQVPLLHVLAPEAKIVPIAVPPTETAIEIGRAVGKKLSQDDDALPRIVGSTDLTHHGGHFPSPGGRGQAGIQWSVDNDRRMIDLIARMRDAEIIEEARQRGNACGAGAIAATVAACRQLGASQGHLLEYTNSQEVMSEMYPSQTDDTTVGYASIVFG